MLTKEQAIKDATEHLNFQLEWTFNHSLDDIALKVPNQEEAVKILDELVKAKESFIEKARENEKALREYRHLEKIEPNRDYFWEQTVSEVARRYNGSVDRGHPVVVFKIEQDGYRAVHLNFPTEMYGLQLEKRRGLLGSKMKATIDPTPVATFNYIK